MFGSLRRLPNGWRSQHNTTVKQQRWFLIVQVVYPVPSLNIASDENSTKQNLRPDSNPDYHVYLNFSRQTSTLHHYGANTNYFIESAPATGWVSAAGRKRNVIIPSVTVAFPACLAVRL